MPDLPQPRWPFPESGPATPPPTDSLEGFFGSVWDAEVLPPAGDPWPRHLCMPDLERHEPLGPVLRADRVPPQHPRPASRHDPDSAGPWFWAFWLAVAVVSAALITFVVPHLPYLP